MSHQMRAAVDASLAVDAQLCLYYEFGFCRKEKCHRWYVYGRLLRLFDDYSFTAL